VALTSSGGVVDLDRDYGGLGARLIWKGSAAGRPLTLKVGADVARQKEHRQGFVNNFGVIGALRRDENDTVTGTDAYAEAQWWLLDPLALTVGVRSSRVHYNSADDFITAANPDDSGSRTYYNTSPIVGVVWHAANNLNLYVSYGQGFENRIRLPGRTTRWARGSTSISTLPPRPRTRWASSGCPHRASGSMPRSSRRRPSRRSW
jgi:iron complex outermembrane receptor protein